MIPNDDINSTADLSICGIGGAVDLQQVAVTGYVK